MAALFLTGCTTWNTLIERRKAKEKYDEFAEMSKAAIHRFNADPRNEDKIICKEEKPTGSNIPVRACYWKSHIDKRREEDQRAVEDIIRNTPLPRAP